MNYATEVLRKQAGVCIKCEGSPVVWKDHCAACASKYHAAERKRSREQMGCAARQIWSPEKQCFVLYDDREAYDQIRAQVAKEIGDGAKGRDMLVKYKMTWTRLKKICMEYGVAMTRKRGDRWKTPERVALEAAVLADARAGMCLRDLKKKYPGHEVRYICRKAGVIPKSVESVEGQRCEAPKMNVSEVNVSEAQPSSVSASSRPC